MVTYPYVTKGGPGVLIARLIGIIVALISLIAIILIFAEAGLTVLGWINLILFLAVLVYFLFAAMGDIPSRIAGIAFLLLFILFSETLITGPLVEIVSLFSIGLGKEWIVYVVFLLFGAFLLLFHRKVRPTFRSSVNQTFTR